MFQSFDTPADPSQGPARLAALRDVLAAEGLDGVLVPRADAHQGEYVAACDSRLSWLTGFSGSAGFCIALSDVAGVFIDGRYRNQVRTQVDLGHFTPVPWPEVQAGAWIADHAPEGGRIAYDPWLHTAREVEALEAALAPRAIALVPGANLVDRIWSDRPAPPAEPIIAQPEALAGESAAAKRARIAAMLVSAGQRAAVLTLPDSIAWLLNIRGSDVPHNPVVQAFALIHDSGHVDLFTQPGRALPEGGLGEGVTLLPVDGFEAALGQLDGPVRIDKGSAPMALAHILEAAQTEIAWDEDPCVLPKAVKNQTELAGAREAHLRDGAAVVEFLAWYAARSGAGEALTEIDLVSALEDSRRATNQLREISFETIAGAGPNGAVIHYRVTHETNRTLAPGELVVLDSGAQYQDGTTDITRTLRVGTPGDQERRAFTRVLKGMIAISRARFPKGLAGRDLDALARYPLWLAHMDYNHGTGHGVGSYLSVHEGPQRISRLSEVPLEPGMILSNEPGYYRDGAFGIRIENLIAVAEAQPLPGGDAQRDMLCFETLTYVPIDTGLIEPDLLDAEERAWLDAYHADVLQRVGPRLTSDARIWLEGACAPL